MSAPPLPLGLEEVVHATAGRLESPSAPEDRRPPPAFLGVSIDSRTVKPGELFVAIKGPNFDGHDFLADAARRGAAGALVHREVADAGGLSRVRVADTTSALADLARHVRTKAAIPVICITGSVGKTTTKEMTATLLESRGPVLKSEGNLNNQYGLPLSLLRLTPEHTAAVLELGMSGFGELRMLSAIARPDVAVITLVAPVHLEFFSSVDEIARAKAEILEGLRPGGVAVLNGDDPRLRAMGKEWKGRTVWFGKDRAFDVSAENWRGTVQGMRFDLRLGDSSFEVTLPLAGAHFMLNFLAAAATAHHLGVSPETIVARASHLLPARHRGQVLRLGQGITVLDDCYNSSPTAVEAAVQALGLSARGRRVAFLGDMLELGPTGPELHREAGKKLRGKVDVLVAVGAHAPHLLDGGGRAGLPASSLHSFPDSAAAAAAAPDLVQPGDAVLVKGSRGVRLEQVVEALVKRFGSEGAA